MRPTVPIRSLKSNSKELTKPWTPVEDGQMLLLIELHGRINRAAINWLTVSANMTDAGFLRTAEQCRERYHKYLLEPIKKKTDLTEPAPWDREDGIDPSKVKSDSMPFQRAVPVWEQG